MCQNGKSSKVADGCGDCVAAVHRYGDCLAVNIGDGIGITAPTIKIPASSRDSGNLTLPVS